MMISYWEKLKSWYWKIARKCNDHKIHQQSFQSGIERRKEGGRANNRDGGRDGGGQKMQRREVIRNISAASLLPVRLPFNGQFYFTSCAFFGRLRFVCFAGGCKNISAALLISSSASIMTSRSQTSCSEVLAVVWFKHSAGKRCSSSVRFLLTAVFLKFKDSFIESTLESECR